MRDKAHSLRLKEKSGKIDFAVHVLSCQTDTAAGWFSRIEEQAVIAGAGEESREGVYRSSRVVACVLESKPYPC